MFRILSLVSALPLFMMSDIGGAAAPVETPGDRFARRVDGWRDAAANSTDPLVAQEARDWLDLYTVLSGEGAAPAPATVDLSLYALKSDLASYALKSDIPAPVDTSAFALKSDIPAAVDTSSFARKSDIPDVSDFVTRDEASALATPAKK